MSETPIHPKLARLAVETLKARAKVKTLELLLDNQTMITAELGKFLDEAIEGLGEVEDEVVKDMLMESGRDSFDFEGHRFTLRDACADPDYPILAIESIDTATTPDWTPETILQSEG